MNKMSLNLYQSKLSQKKLLAICLFSILFFFQLCQGIKLNLPKNKIKNAEKFKENKFQESIDNILERSDVKILEEVKKRIENLYEKILIDFKKQNNELTKEQKKSYKKEFEICHRIFMKHLNEYLDDQEYDYSLIMIFKDTFHIMADILDQISIYIE